jgi:hypothetical protein
MAKISDNDYHSGMQREEEQRKVSEMSAFVADNA